MQSRELPWLDWLRFTAAFLVLVVHARSMTFVAYGDLPDEQKSLASMAFYALTNLGFEAVLLFFVISGYLVGGRAIERVHVGAFDFASYAIDRISRIYVPLVPAVALVVIAGHLAGQAPDLWSVLGVLAGLQGLVTETPPAGGPLWTLAYEWWLYVMAGAAALLIDRRRVQGFLLLCLAAFALSFGRMELLVAWGLGAAAYFYRPARWRTLIICACLAALVVATSQVWFGRDGIVASTQIASMLSFLPRSAAAVLFAGGAALLVATLSSMPEPKTALYRFGKPLAAFSYTLYLTHYPVLWVCFAWWPQQPITTESLSSFVARVVLCLVTAWAMYWLFERHTPRVRSLLRERRVIG